MLGPVVIMHCNKALYCMRTLEFLMSRAPCVTILHHNPLYRSSDYISNYSHAYRTNYRGPMKFDITGFYCMWLLSELGRDDRAVFKGGLLVQPPEMLRRKFLTVSESTPSDMWVLTHSMFALLWCQEKPSGVYKMRETAWAAGAPPRTTLGELTALPQTP